MKRILFIDAICNKEYSHKVLATKALGGTEASVVRLAEKLGEKHHVHVMQSHRGVVEAGGTHVTYSPLRIDVLNEKWDAVVLVRMPELLPFVRGRLPHAKVVLWLHDLADGHLKSNVAILEDSKPTVVTVSRFHQLNVLEALKSVGCKFNFTVTNIHNPIDSKLAPDDTAVDKNKLVFFSSPHKGLTNAIELFKCAQRINPYLRLYVSNPGYLPSYDTGSIDGVYNLGALSHRDALQHVRSALCVFYPNTVFPETFGLVFAEANAVGTPVLTHGLGAAYEVLTSPKTQIVDTKDIKLTVDKLISWQNGDRPTVTANEAFRVEAVSKQWETLLGLE